jgi:hypothetical protein
LDKNLDEEFPECIAEVTAMEEDLEPHMSLKSFLALPLTRWPDGQVPYVINPSLGEEGKQLVLNAMDHVRI